MDLLTAIVRMAFLFEDAKEQANNNRGDFIDFISKRFGLQGVEWCAIFAVTIVEWASELLNLKTRIPHTASSQSLFYNSADLGAVYTDPKLNKPGHLMVYRKGDDWKGHVGFIVNILPEEKRQTIEGNVPDVDFGSGHAKNEQGVNVRVRSVAPEEFKKDGWYIVGFIDPEKLVVRQ